MSRLTAQQARELAVDKVAQEVDKVLLLIKTQALIRPVTNNNFQIELFDNFWGFASKDRCKAYDILKALGYHVEEITREIALWGRYGTVIHWK